MKLKLIRVLWCWTLICDKWATTLIRNKIHHFTLCIIHDKAFWNIRKTSLGRGIIVLGQMLLFLTYAPFDTLSKRRLTLISNLLNKWSLFGEGRPCFFELGRGTDWTFESLMLYQLFFHGTYFSGRLRELTWLNILLSTCKWFNWCLPGFSLIINFTFKTFGNHIWYN